MRQMYENILPIQFRNFEISSVHFGLSNLTKKKKKEKEIINKKKLGGVL